MKREALGTAKKHGKIGDRYIDEILIEAFFVISLLQRHIKRLRAFGVFFFCAPSPKSKM